MVWSKGLLLALERLIVYLFSLSKLALVRVRAATRIAATFDQDLSSLALEVLILIATSQNTARPGGTRADNSFLAS